MLVLVGSWPAQRGGESSWGDMSKGQDALALKMITMNGSCWEPCKAALLKGAEKGGHVFFVQEHRLAHPDRIAEASQGLGALGFKSLWSPVVSSEASGKKGTSGGVALVVHGSLGLREANGGADLVPGRAVGGIIEAPGYNPILVVSLYLEVGTKLGVCNLGVLSVVGKLIEEAGCSWIIGGDWNMDRKLVELTGFVARLRGSLVSPERPTCISPKSASTIDYFACSRRMADTVRGITTMAGIDLPPHRPVMLTLAPRVVEMRRKTIRKPQHLPVTLPFGPINSGVCWELVLAAASVLDDIVGEADAHVVDGALEAVYRLFANKAEEELARFADVVLRRPGERGEPPQLVEVPLVPSKLVPGTLWKSMARPLRWVSQRDREAISIIRGAVGVGVSALLQRRLAYLEAELQEEAPQMVQDSVVASKALGEVQTIVSAAVIDANPLLFGRAFPQAEAMLLSILGELREHIDKETIQVQVGAEQRWKKWAEESLNGGAGRAHRWAKLPQAWVPTTSGNKAGHFSATLAHLLQTEAERLRELWASSSSPGELDYSL